jgi:hypothetical protein
MADIKVSALPAGNATPTGVIPVVNNGVTQKVTVKSIVDLATASMPSGTVDTTATGPITGLTASPNLPIQQWSEEMALKAAFKDTPVTFTRVRLQDLSGGGGVADPIGGDGWVLADYGYFGTLNYGNQPGSARAAGNGYELPTPTQQGYLRADLDPASGWYFAEPVIVSDTAPPKPMGDPALPTLWIDPTGTSTGAGTGEFTTDNPITFADDPILEQEDGTPIGLSADGLTFHQPLITGAIPVVIGGKKYLIPVCDT